MNRLFSNFIRIFFICSTKNTIILKLHLSIWWGRTAFWVGGIGSWSWSCDRRCDMVLKTLKSSCYLFISYSYFNPDSYRNPPPPHKQIFLSPSNIPLCLPPRAVRPLGRWCPWGRAWLPPQVSSPPSWGPGKWSSQPRSLWLWARTGSVAEWSRWSSTAESWDWRRGWCIPEMTKHFPITADYLYATCLSFYSPPPLSLSLSLY